MAENATSVTSGGKPHCSAPQPVRILSRPIKPTATRCSRLLKGKPGVGVKRKTDRHTEAQEIRQRLMGMKGVDADSKNYPVDQCVDHAYGGVLDEVMPHKQ